MDNQLKVCLIIIAIGLVLCFVSLVFKHSRLLIFSIILLVLIGLRTGVVYLALGYEEPDIEADLDDVPNPRGPSTITITLPNVNYIENKDALGFGLDGFVEDVKGTSNKIYDNVKSEIQKMSEKNDTDNSDTKTNNTEENSIEKSNIQEINIESTETEENTEAEENSIPEENQEIEVEPTTETNGNPLME